FRAAPPLMFAGSSTPRSSRGEAADRMMRFASVSFDIGILRWVAAASLPLPPRPHLGHAAGGAGSRGARGARNGHTTALFTDECQSFLDNVIAGLGQIGSWKDPRIGSQDRPGRSATARIYEFAMDAGFGRVGMWRGGCRLN